MHIDYKDVASTRQRKLMIADGEIKPDTHVEKVTSKPEPKHIAARKLQLAAPEVAAPAEMASDFKVDIPEEAVKSARKLTGHT